MTFEPTATYTEAQREAVAQMDLEDIKGSDALILLAGPEKYSGGKFVEAGYAMGKGKPVVIVGRRENMLLWLPSIIQVNSVRDALALLERWETAA